MSMSKQDFIALADAIREHNQHAANQTSMPWGIKRLAFSKDQIESLAEFCQEQNSRFMRDRWLSYIAGECGKNGGKVRAA